MNSLFQVIAESAKWVYRNRAIWLLGVLLALFSGSVIDYSALHLDLHLGNSIALGSSQWTVILVVILLFIFVVASYLISTWTTIVTIREASAGENERPKIEDWKQLDLVAIGKMIVFASLVPLVLLLVGYLVAIPASYYFYSLVNQDNTVLMGVILVLISVVLGLVFIAGVAVWLYTILTIITSSKKITEAFRASFTVFRNNIVWSMLLVVLVVVANYLFKSAATVILNMISSNSDKLINIGNLPLGYLSIAGYFAAFAVIVFAAGLFSVISISTLVRWHKKIASA